MNADYDAVVIGSGFGGAVAALRLAQAGLRVCVIERGRRYPMGTFPRDWRNPAGGWLWPLGQGLFDFKPFNEMMVVQGAGYGGGSLIYANVHVRAPADVFSSGWPVGYSRTALDPYYDLVAYMLDIKPITASGFKGLPPKTQLMSQAAAQLGRSAQFCYPNVAVDFGVPGVVHANKFGVQQSGCTYCGECDIGCNILAKNTLDLNYLALAERSGAEPAPQCEVTAIAPSDGGYRVRFRDHGAGSDGATETRMVFLCAGAVNSTELLLRCRDQYKTLPRLSDRLGQGYSGNGDFLAFCFGTEQAAEPWNGPTITAGIVFDRGAGADRTWFILEEGGYPKEIAALLKLLDPGQDWLTSVGQGLKDALLTAIKRSAAATLLAPPADAAHSMVFLAMGRDRANGSITLEGPAYQPCVDWDVASNLALYDAEQGLSADIARALGGRLALNPFWQTIHLPVSVHNLGGCVMADDPSRGVTDADGAVYGYPGLYVLDGAILPAATGVNPSHTIAAVAERNIESIIRTLKNEPGWRAPEMAAAQHVVEPVSQLVIPKEGTVALQSGLLRIEFHRNDEGLPGQGPHAARRLLRRRPRRAPRQHLRGVHAHHHHPGPRPVSGRQGPRGDRQRGGAGRRVHLAGRRAGQRRRLQPLRRNRPALRPQDALRPALPGSGWQAISARRVQGGEGRRPLRHLGHDEHALHRHSRRSRPKRAGPSHRHHAHPAGRLPPPAHDLRRVRHR